MDIDQHLIDECDGQVQRYIAYTEETNRLNRQRIAALEAAIQHWYDYGYDRREAEALLLEKHPTSYERVNVVERDPMVERIAALEAALRVFADNRSWMQNGPCDPNSANFIGTQIAEKALLPGRGE